MQKNISITIGRTVFHVEEGAYEKLAEYLDSLRRHFEGYAEGDEIISDIENRIAEHFLKLRGEEKHHVVREADVEKLIASMGRPEEMGEAETGEVPAKPSPKKLYRNTEDAVLAGVGSGLAAYFNIDVVLVRIVLVLLAFANGFGILFYIVLWIATPEAKTPTEKLKMKGAPVTLESVERIVKAGAENVKKTMAGKNFLRRGAEAVSRAFAFIFRRIIPVAGKIAGYLIAAFAVLAAFAVTAAFALALFNIDSPYVDFPIAAASRGPFLYAAIFAGYLAVLVPVLFVFGLAASLIRGWNSRRTKLAFALLGIWFVALIGLGVAASRIAPRYHEFLRTDPEYRPVTQAYDLRDFTRVSVANGVMAEISEGPEFLVEAEGRARDVSSLSARVENGELVLALERRPGGKICILCPPGGTRVRVTAPAIGSVAGMNAARISVSGITAAQFEAAAKNGSRMELSFATSTERIEAEAESASTVWLSGPGTRLLVLSVRSGSRAEAEGLPAAEATVEARNAAMARVSAGERLFARAENGSHILYSGSPELIEEVRNASRIRPDERFREEGYR